MNLYRPCKNGHQRERERERFSAEIQREREKQTETDTREKISQLINSHFQRPCWCEAVSPPMTSKSDSLFVLHITVVFEEEAS